MRDRPVLIDLATGRVLPDARIVGTRFGQSWRSDELDVWAPVAPARRTTMTKKGVVSAHVPFLCRSSRNGTWALAPLGSPLADDWNERIAR